VNGVVLAEKHVHRPSITLAETNLAQNMLHMPSTNHPTMMRMKHGSYVFECAHPVAYHAPSSQQQQLTTNTHNCNNYYFYSRPKQHKTKRTGNQIPPSATTQQLDE